MMFAVAAALFSISCIQLVTSQCPQNCQSCFNNTKCLSCKVGYWAAYFGCVNTCSNNCANSTCDDNGYCYACVNGMYGPNCNQECRLCLNEECGPRECTSGCKTGYFQDINGDYSYCYPCQDNCQQCLNSTYCTLCDSGYYIYKNTYAFEPKRGTATCIDCENNYVCDDCSMFANCSQCSFDLVQTTCEHCTAGYTLNNRQCVKTVACSTHCLNGCTVNGECYGCIDGKTGKTCSFSCFIRCAKCSQTNQDMCEACKKGFYKNSCGIRCPQNCADRQCDFSNGICLNGCLSGFWGYKCEYICDHCTQSECNRDGTCSHGCISAYGGLYCNITMTNAPSTLLTSSISSVISSTQRESSTRELTVGNCQEGSSISRSMLGGAVTGAVLITALIVGSIAFCMYRRLSSLVKKLDVEPFAEMQVTVRNDNSAKEIGLRLASKSGSKEQQTDTMYYNTSVRSTTNDETGFTNIIMASEMGTNQTPEISVYDQLLRTNTEHECSGL